jgi:hypothetical protein
MRRVVSQPRVVFLVLITRRRGKRDSPLVVVTGAFRLFGLIPRRFVKAPGCGPPESRPPPGLSRTARACWTSSYTLSGPATILESFVSSPSSLWLFFLPFLYLPNTGMLLCLLYIPLCILPPSQNKCNFMIQNLSHKECYFD